MRPLSIPSYIKAYWNGTKNQGLLIEETRAAYSKLLKGAPEVTIIIPAYNEEQTVVQTLSSIAQNVTSYSVEIIVANNNSSDRTGELVGACGVTCVFEPRQGIDYARNCGLANARGKYIINADADTIYPRNWIQSLVTPLMKDERIAVCYGRYSFLPIAKTPRLIYFFYECFADVTRKLNRVIKDEAVNVYGCNSAFRKEQGLQVDGYNHPKETGTTEDGYLAYKLRNAGFGRLHFVRKALVWTTDRRIHIDGGLWVGTVKRMKRVFLTN